MQERIDHMNEARAQKEQETANEPDIDCSTRLKALWMMFSSSFLAKAFIVVGGVVCIFGIVMLIIGFATDSFNGGKTIGPVLAGVGLIILIIGLLAIRSAYVSQRKVAQGEDPEKATGQNKTQKNEAVPNGKANADNNVNIMRLDEHSDKGSDSDVDTASKPISTSRMEKKGSISARSDHGIPLVSTARPRTLPPLQRPEKPPAAKKKKKTKTPRRNSTVSEGNYTGEISTISSSYGVNGLKPAYENDGFDNDGNDDADWSNYRSKSFNYE